MDTSLPVAGPEAGAPPRSFGHCLKVAFAAAVLGSLAGAVLVVPFEFGGQIATARDAGFLLVAMVFASLVGLGLALPASLVVGPALLWPSQRLVARFPLAASVAFALIGIVLARELSLWLNRDTIRPEDMLGAAMTFGGTVAAFHVLLFDRATRRLRRFLPLALATLAIAVPSGRFVRDQILNQHAWANFEGTCREGYAIIAMRPDLLDAVRADLRLAPGKRRHRLAFRHSDWHEPAEHNTAISRGASLTVDGVRALELYDVTYAPLTPWSRFGFARSVERQCLTHLPGADADLARRLGMVEAIDPGMLRRPSLL